MKSCYAQYKYLLAIYELARNKDRVKSVDIANRLGVSRPSVSKTIKCLYNSGFVNEDYANEIVLTPLGRETGKELYDNYRYVNLFFRKVLKLSDEQADEQTLTFMAAFPEETIEKLSETMKSTILRQREIRRSKQS